MVIAFLDLLAFSWLMGFDLSIASHNLDLFNRILRTKILDEQTHPTSDYDPIIQEFVENTSVTSFKNMISISDSLILGSDDPDVFIKQLCNFVSSAFIVSNIPFRKSFKDIKVVEDKYEYNHEEGTVKIGKKGAFPLLFRGGISEGNLVFRSEIQIKNNETTENGLNVFGIPYLQAVKLESSGKGPRLFCSKSFVNSLQPKSRKAIRLVGMIKGEEVYEIVWTYYAFEVITNSHNKIENIKRCLDETVLPAAINLFNYYKRNEDNRPHYLELVKLIYRGAIKYAHDEIGCDKETLKILKLKANQLKMVEELFDVSDFIL